LLSCRRCPTGERLIAVTTVEEFVARAASNTVVVRTPEASRLRDLMLGPGITIVPMSR
jgi:ABC-2 type transport system ATP-binding protein